MTTLTQLDKFSSAWFSDQMRRRGFAVEKKFIFWRKRGPLYDMFQPQVLSGGGDLRIFISIWSPWFDHPESGELGEFPPDYAAGGSILSEKFPERLRDEFAFPVATAEEAAKSFEQMLALIDQRALPWFPTINSYESFVALVNSRSFMGTRERKEEIRKNMLRAFELEPYD